MRGCVGATAWVVATLGCGLSSALAADTAKQPVETVRFADPRWPSVKVVRGAFYQAVPLPKPAASRPSPASEAALKLAPSRQSYYQAVPLPKPATSEIVTFGDGRGQRVQIVRGASANDTAGLRSEVVRFAGGGVPLVNVLRGSSLGNAATELFGAAQTGELDRVAYAVDGAESGHGSNLAMWRPDPEGPQGPMQVSAAAALDVGGGDRFDMGQNRLLGRAYLAKLYQRYGSWPDAIAAYNWGPGNLDQWIAAGRPADTLPLETARYLLKVLRDAFLIGDPRL
jgi:hypothetical protein